MEAFMLGDRDKILENILSEPIATSRTQQENVSYSFAQVMRSLNVRKTRGEKW